MTSRGTAFQAEGMAWAKAGSMRRETDENKVCFRDCEGPGSATQSSWTREDETLWADTSLPEIPRGQSRGGVPLSLTSTWDLTVPICREKAGSGGQEAILQTQSH